MPPLNMPLWQINYLELQSLEKQSVQGHSDGLCSPGGRK